MERSVRRSTRPFAWLWIAGVTAALLLGLPVGGPTAALETATQGGMNPAAQRQEMIRLLGSIDKSLKDLLEATRSR